MKQIKNIRYVLFLLACSSLSAELKLGIENIHPRLVQKWKKCSIGLVTNNTGKDQQGRRNVDIFKEKGMNIRKLFAPEHGINGAEKAGEHIAHGKDDSLQIPVVSLYGQGLSTKKVDSVHLQDIDTIFFDIQDSGMRHYTYISTLYYVLEAAAEHDKKIVVFDRPNPLGMVMEGPLVDAELRSFISIAEIPLRHGLTIGEMAAYFNTFVLKKKAQLTVIPMKSYERATGMASFLAPLSPNIASHSSCLGYSFLGLLGEIKPFDVGVGTEDAFQVILLPEVLSIPEAIWHELARALKVYGIDSVVYHMFNFQKNQYYKGLRISIANINQVMAFQALLLVVSTIKKAGVSLEFSALFDKAAGTSKVRSYLLGDISYNELADEINNKLQQFFPKAQSILRYAPHPHMNLI